MTPQELYDHITKSIPAEKALLKLLESSVINYKHLKFKEDEEIHPTILIAMAALEMGWNIAVSEDDDENIEGMIVGSEEYIDKLI